LSTRPARTAADAVVDLSALKESAPSGGSWPSSLGAEVAEAAAASRQVQGFGSRRSGLRLGSLDSWRSQAPAPRSSAFSTSPMRLRMS